MTRKTKYRKHTHFSKTNNLDIKILSWTAVLVVLFAVVALFSMGSRAHKGSRLSQTRFQQFRNKIRDWEDVVNVNSNPKIRDVRSHTAFHFQWNKKSHAPLWNANFEDAKARQQNIERTLALGKSKIQLTQLADDTLIFDLRESISTNANITAHKRVLPLLPGDKVLLSYDPDSPASKSWKARLRAVAATQDRLDAPMQLKLGFTNDTTTLSIDPRGEPLDVDLPVWGDFVQKQQKVYAIEWPKTASGILLIEGVQQTKASAELKAPQPRTLIVHIDSLGHSLNQLRKTLSALKQSNAERTTLHLSSTVPGSESQDAALNSLLTLRDPIDLGMTLEKSEIPAFLSSEPVMFKKFLNHHNGTLRRLSVYQSDSRCTSDCAAALPTEPWSSHFNSEISVVRREEFASATAVLRNDEFFAESGVLLVDVHFPERKLRLNWTSAFDSDVPFFRWVIGGIRTLSVIPAPEIKNAEKLSQIDDLLAGIVETFLAAPEPANIAVVLHKNSSAKRLEAIQSKSHQLTLGEALFSFNKTDLSDTDLTTMKTIDTPIAMLSALQMFERLSQTSGNSLDLNQLTRQLDFQTAPISQINSSSIVTMTANGWVRDRLPGTTDGSELPLLLAEPERVVSLLESTQKERRKSRLNGLNIQFPPNNETSEQVSVLVSTNLLTLSCESDHENTTIVDKTKDDQEASDPMRTYLISAQRSQKSQLHVQCFLEGRITPASRLQITAKVNNQGVARERIGLGEFALPIRGFAWRSPETLELIGPQIIDATVAVRSPGTDSTHQGTVLVWTDLVMASVPQVRTVLPLDVNARSRRTGAEPQHMPDRLSGK